MITGIFLEPTLAKYTHPHTLILKEELRNASRKVSESEIFFLISPCPTPLHIPKFL